MAKHCGAVGFVEVSAKEGFSQDADEIHGTIGSVINFACYVAFANNPAAFPSKQRIYKKEDEDEMQLLGLFFSQQEECVWFIWLWNKWKEALIIIRTK